MRLSRVCLFSVLAIAGCKPTGDPVISGHQTASTDLPAGWKRIESDTAKVSIGLPPDWHKKSMSQSEMKEGSSLIKSNNAADDNLKAAGAEAAQDQSIKLIFDHGMVKGSDFDLNGNIVVLPSQGYSLDQVAQASDDEIKTLGVKNLKTKNETLAAGDCRVFEYNRSIGLPSGSVDLDFISYLLVQNGNQYILTFSVPAGDTSLNAEIDQMAQTFKEG